jgi:Trk K+ transport system NAD-binding subunit
LQVPDIDGVLVGFSRIRAGDAEVAGVTVGEAERRMDARIIAANDVPPDAEQMLAADAELTIFRAVRPNEGGSVRGAGALSGARLRGIIGRAWRLLRHSDPVVRGVIAAALTIMAMGTFYFSWRLGTDAFTAAYFVVTTMTTTGYGDIRPPARDVVARAVAMALMVSGVAFSGMFVAIVAARLTRAQWVSLHGLRKIYRRGHFVVCGAGQVGSRVVDFLLRMKQRVVVIEANPSAAIIERSRERHFDLLTGDATDSEVLSFSNIKHARGLIALTESDTMNLEAALSARAHNAALPIVMRVNEVGLADSIKSHFGLDHTFGTAALSAPAFAGLAFHPGSRGRVIIGGKEYAISERDANDVAPQGGAGQGIPLCVRRNGETATVRDMQSVAENDQVLLLYPLNA